MACPPTGLAVGLTPGGHANRRVSSGRYGRISGRFAPSGPIPKADRPVISRLGLNAFVYGGAEDNIADPSEDEPFAADLRAAGAVAHGAVYPGGHSLETVQAHLGSMLVFAGRALARGSAPPRPAPVSR